MRLISRFVRSVGVVGGLFAFGASTLAFGDPQVGAMRENSRAGLVPAFAATACQSSAETQRDLLDCAEAQFRESDRKLNVLYASVMSDCSSSDKVRLRTAQRAWIAFRDAQCAAAAGLYEGGSMALFVAVACRSDLTEYRYRQIVATYRKNSAP